MAFAISTEKKPPDLVFSKEQEFSPRRLWVFTDTASAKRTHDLNVPLGEFSTGHSASAWIDMFDPLLFAFVVINPGGPEDQHWVASYSQMGTLQRWKCGLALENAASAQEPEKLHQALNAPWLTLYLAEKSGVPIVTQADQSTAYARVAATLDAQQALGRMLGDEAAIKSMSAAQLRRTLDEHGVDRFMLHGANATLPTALLPTK